MAFALGFIFGLVFLTLLFYSGGDVFQQLAKARIELEEMTRQRDELLGEINRFTIIRHGRKK